MNQDTFNKIEFDKIIDALSQFAVSLPGKETIRELVPSANLAVVKARLTETEQARALLEAGLHVPFMGLSKIDHLTSQVSKGFVLSAEELVEFADFLRSGRLIRDFFSKHQETAPLLAEYSTAIRTFQEAEETIYQAIHHNQVASDYSRQLRKLRHAQQETQADIEKVLQKFLRHPGNSKKIQEFMIVKKQDRFTIPVKASYKNQIQGSVVESSNRGTTVYIEPAAVARLNQKLADLALQESSEVYQILAELTGLIAEQLPLLKENLSAIAAFDVIFARAKYSRRLQGITPLLNQKGHIVLKEAVHPLLPDAVPLNLSLGKGFRGLTITGPNAGGKTVVLKTVALLTFQTMIGVQIRAEEGTEIAVFDQIFVDIGDHQSIENALSTFSGHMQNIARITHRVKGNSLVLLDEIGSGTEPNEGAALAIAIMEELYRKGCMLLTTTHYGEIKRFSELHPDFMTAAMSFNSDTLQPNYRLLMGETGESNAFWIARKMQLDKRVIAKAEQYEKHREYDVTTHDFTAGATGQQAEHETSSESVHYRRGDRVYVTDQDCWGLIYQDDQRSSKVSVSINNQLFDVSRKRVKLEMRREQLYPENYDYDSLFGSFQERKMTRDLLRGSKKAHKKLDREAVERRQEKYERTNKKR